MPNWTELPQSEKVHVVCVEYGMSDWVSSWGSHSFGIMQFARPTDRAAAMTRLVTANPAAVFRQIGTTVLLSFFSAVPVLT